MSQEFQREDRYIVIKRKDLEKVPAAYRKDLVDPLPWLQVHLPRRECLVIESDWPEYEPVWAMVEARMTGAPMPPAGGEVKEIGGIDVAAASVLRFWAEDAHNIRCVRAEDFDAHLTRLQAENAALQHRLNVADQLVDDLKKDKERLDALEANFWDVRHDSSALGDTGDYTSCVEIVGRWMDKPHERVIGENYDENLRAAIDQAMTADAYPPARPEYQELDAALAEEDWHMNPCKQGHRDVGACGGKAFCHTCDETITAATTQEAFEQWNATHPATPQ
jgi:hypothetical protein